MTKYTDDDNEFLFKTPQGDLAQVVRGINLPTIKGQGYSLFTCDSCGLRYRCKLAFDPYNTNGECLLEAIE